MKKTSITLSFFVLLLLSCTNVSEEDLVDNTIPIIDITYTEDVKVIIDNNCTFCHASPPINGAPMSLVTFDNVKEAVENRNLLGRISTEDLGFVMPFGGPRLPQNLINIVIQWETDGLLEE